MRRDSTLSPKALALLVRPPIWPRKDCRPYSKSMRELMSHGLVIRGFGKLFLTASGEIERLRHRVNRMSQSNRSRRIIGQDVHTLHKAEVIRRVKV